MPDLQVSTRDKRPAATPLGYAGPNSPRPGRRMLTPLDGFVVLGLLLILAALLVPSLNVKTQSPRVACSANLRSIGQAVHMYANEHGGQFPDTLEKVVVGGYAPDVRIFLCPTESDTPAQGATREAAAADLTAGGHLSYVYVGAGLTVKTGGNTILLYEHAGHHEGKGGNVLFADGHAQWLNKTELRSVIDWYAAGNGPMVWGKPPPPPRTVNALMQPVRRATP